MSTTRYTKFETLTRPDSHTHEIRITYNRTYHQYRAQCYYNGKLAEHIVWTQFHHESTTIRAIANVMLDDALHSF